MVGDVLEETARQKVVSLKRISLLTVNKKICPSLTQWSKQSRIIANGKGMPKPLGSVHFLVGGSPVCSDLVLSPVRVTYR